MSGYTPDLNTTDQEPYITGTMRRIEAMLDRHAKKLEEAEKFKAEMRRMEAKTRKKRNRYTNGK